jgi:large subunit ribosomal protein L29
MQMRNDMKNTEIREMTTTDLAERVGVETSNYKQMTLNHSISPLENPTQIRQLRRTIARMKTELRQRELTNK